MSHSRRALLLVLLAATCWGTRAPAAEVDPCVPSDVEAVLHVHVRQLLDAPPVKKHFREELEKLLRREDVPAAALLRAAQINPLKDVRSLTAGFRAPAEWVVILRGAFDPAKVHAALEEQAKKAPETVKIHKQEGRQIYAAAGGIFGCLLDRETLVVSSSRDGLRAAVARKDEKKAAPARELRALLDKVDGTQSIWLAAVASPRIKQRLGGGAEVQKVLSRVQGLRGGVTVGDGVQAGLRIEMDEARAAGEVRKLMDALKGILILAAANNEKYGDLLADLVSALKPTSDRDGVTVKGELSAAEIAKRVPKKEK